MEAILRYALKDMEREGIKLIMAHSENGAGYMADGYARATGKVGVCMAQSIGAGNLTGGITDAWLACSPVLAVTGKKNLHLQKRNSYQEYDHTFMYESVTKYNADIADPQQLPYMFRQAMRAASTGKPRPVHLDVVNNLGRDTELSKIADQSVVDSVFAQTPAFRPAAADSKVKEAVRAIAEAKKPVILVGRGARLSDKGDVIIELARKFDVPVVTSPDGKTVIDENDVLWAGVCGYYGMDCANRTLHHSDLVVVIGSQMNDQTTCDWTCPPMNTKIVQIDIDPEEIGRNYADCIGLPGDAKTVVEQLLAEGESAKHDEWRRKVSGYVAETLEEYAVLQQSDCDLIRPERLCYEISKALPEDAVLVSDTGYSAEWTSTMLRMKASQDYFRAAGSLGWALPGSLGVKCGVGDRPVFCFIGDGGMYYHLCELETAVRCNIKTITIVNNNGILSQCSNDIKNVYADDPKTAPKRYTFVPTDYRKLAEDFGCWSVRVTKAEEIGPAIAAALKASGPALIEVMTDADTNCPPPLKQRPNEDDIVNGVD